MKQIPKIIAVGAGLVLCFNLAFASELDVVKESFDSATAKFIQKYEETIKTLQDENARLRDENTRLRDGYTGSIAKCKTGTTTTTTKPTTPPSAATATGKTTTTVTTPTATGASSESFATTNATYIAIMKKIQANSGSIFSENNLSGTLSIGLFEFIEPGAFFISIDDGNNSAGNTAFKYKLLFSYDTGLSMKKVGAFTFLPDVEKYLTTFGSNPYAKATRIKVKNPYYKGKLLAETTATTSTPTSSTSTTTTTTPTTTTSQDVTLAQVKAAYEKNNIPLALSLSNSYIVKDPNNIEVLTIRYRGYFMIGKLTESLAEIAKIETIQGASFSSKIACDGKKIATSAKNTSLTTHYTALCTK